MMQCTYSWPAYFFQARFYLFLICHKNSISHKAYSYIEWQGDMQKALKHLLQCFRGMCFLIFYVSLKMKDTKIMGFTMKLKFSTILY